MTGGDNQGVVLQEADILVVGKIILKLNRRSLISIHLSIEVSYYNRNRCTNLFSAVIIELT